MCTTLLQCVLPSCRFDLRRFYCEARRVLKPGSGCLAAWCYGLPVLEADGHPANTALLHLYEGVLGPYWDERRRMVEQAYAGECTGHSSWLTTGVRLPPAL